MTEDLHPGRTLRRRQHAQQGYILLTLLLVIALIAVGMALAVQSLSFQIKRDREEELVHRGVQYSRAIRRYSKQTGLFPAHIEDLRNLGGQRFIRKLYKDPITGKDFELVYEADIRNPQTLASRGLTAAPDSGNDAGAADAQALPNANQDPASQDPASQVSANQAPANPTLQPVGATGAGLAGAQAPANTDRLLPRGGLIFGVVSKSKDETIREFNHKNHYNEWMFFYYPSYDRGQEIKGPTPLGGYPAPVGGLNQPPAQPPSTP